MVQNRLDSAKDSRRHARLQKILKFNYKSQKSVIFDVIVAILALPKDTCFDKKSPFKNFEKPLIKVSAVSN